MVRTYSFNPSTQSRLTQGEGFVVGGSNSLPALPVLHSAVPHQRQMPQGKRASEPWNAPQQNGPKGPSLDSLVSSGASTLSSVASQHSSSTAAFIQEEQTTLFTIRSVLINGQRFFQPLEMPASAPQSSIPIHPAILAITANNSNGNDQKLTEEGEREWRRREKRGNGEEGGRVGRMEGAGNQFPHSTTANPPISDPKMLMPTTGPLLFGGFDEGGGDGLPWARGNPQPKSGLRGSREWQAAHQRNPFDQSFGSSTLSWPPGGGLDVQSLQQRNEQERHRLELLRQIDENRARKARERQREWEAEERQRIKDELWHQRQRLEMEEERRREREKAMIAELKAAKLAEARRATEDALLREKAKMRQQQQTAMMARRKGREDFGAEREEEEGEEWWERKDRLRAQQQRAESPAVPALQRRFRNEGNEGQRSLSVGSRGSQKGVGRQSRHAYSPSAASRKSTRNGAEIGAENGRKKSGEGRRTMDFDI